MCSHSYCCLLIISSLQRIAREIYMWSKAKHPNIHELQGIVIFRDCLSMVSPWMDNGNLRQYIEKKPNANRYRLCVDVAEGVSYLHSITMVHGDIKGINILVSQQGVAKLSDFDHSILSDSSLRFSATTRTDGGTVRWMAPELLLHSDENTAPSKTTQTDVYALGMVCMFHLSPLKLYLKSCFRQCW
ncbi:kinase-like protein [Ceratobasidium sp. AG-I]|nr:kinase-like protein [Ceratobasidium sp. AG-I]